MKGDAKVRKDAGGRELLEGILTSSEEHADWLESQFGIIDKIEIGNYLSEQRVEEK